MQTSAGVIGRARRSDVKKFTDRADLIIAVGYDPIEINYEEWVKPGTPIVHLSTEAAESGNGLNLIWNKACNLDAAIRAMSATPATTNDWSSTGLPRASRCLGQSAPSSQRELCAVSGFGYFAREASGRRHTGLRRRRAHPSNRSPVAHRCGQDSARDQRLVVDGLRHAGGVRGETRSSPIARLSAWSATAAFR